MSRSFEFVRALPGRRKEPSKGRSGTAIALPSGRFPRQAQLSQLLDYLVRGDERTG